jgi:hypothetical protein
VEREVESLSLASTMFARTLEVAGAPPTAIFLEAIATPVNTNLLGIPRRPTLADFRHGVHPILGKLERPDLARLPTMLTLSGIRTTTSRAIVCFLALGDVPIKTHLFELIRVASQKTMFPTSSVGTMVSSEEK